MKNPLIEQLLEKYLLETITEEERRQFFALLEDPDCQAYVMECIGEDLRDSVFDEGGDPLMASRIKGRLAGRIERDRRGKRVPLFGGRVSEGRLLGYRRLVGVAASVLLIAVGLGIWWGSRRSVSSVAGGRQVAIKRDVPPGKEGAILTLADGTTIDLDSAANGQVLQQGATKITKVNGLLAYNGPGNGTGDAGGGDAGDARGGDAGDARGGDAGQGVGGGSGNGAGAAEVLYNTVTVPPAHQVQLALADGSRVWLNASSSLRFPTAFTGGERVVELTGEGYFEVAHKAGQSFAVKVGGMQVQDIGTQFDIMAYADERSIRTTLVEGSARVTNGIKSVVLRPNDQAEVTTNQITVRPNADVDEAVAWKNGVFLFKGTDMAYMLRQIGRWYNVAIVFPGGVPKGHIEADIPRTMNLSKVMEVLRVMGISCKLDGEILIIN